MLAELLKDKPFCLVLKREVEKYFEDEEHEKQFQEWYEKRYGKKYEQ